jgi:hypothetical protein
MFVTGARTIAPVGAGAMSVALGGYASVDPRLRFGRGGRRHVHGRTAHATSTIRTGRER